MLNANSVEPDQTPHSAASDLGLHCFPLSFSWDARHKWVKFSFMTDSNFDWLPCHLKSPIGKRKNVK